MPHISYPVSLLCQTVLHKPVRFLQQKALGSASIAQAHAAILKSGESVVVKVQREGIHEVKDVLLPAWLERPVQENLSVIQPTHLISHECS